MANILLGFNCNCFTNRYDEPEVWAGICHELGVKHVMFNVDLIDPRWPWELQKRLCDETLEACSKYGVSIQASFGGHHNHQHYLGHYDRECRRDAENFFKSAIRQTAYLGGKSFGTCFAIQTMRCNNDPALRKEIMEDAVSAYCHLADYGAEVGLKALAYEMTSVPRETCATFEENDYILERCSRMAIPMRICLDLGHRNMNGNEEEKDHLAWIRKYGSKCDVIDCQQTDVSASHHWPFTDEFNNKGVVKPWEVVQAINDSGAEQVLLGFELKTAAYYPHDDQHYSRLKSSVDYWRQWVKE
jgi:hypothetical protein